MVPRRAVPASGVGCSGPRGDRAPGVSSAWRSALGTRDSGNRRWIDAAIPHPARSLDKARQLLRDAGFRWTNEAQGEPALVDAEGKPVEFSILTSSSNADRTKMATLIQDDLKQLGMRVQVVPLEFRSLIDRVTQSKEYDACVLGLVSFDADPNSDINVWLSSGGTHLWNPSQEHPATPWKRRWIASWSRN